MKVGFKRENQYVFNRHRTFFVHFATVHRLAHRHRHFSFFSCVFLAGWLLLFPRNVSPSLHPNGPIPRKIALTFDDGPHPAATFRLCEVLARYKVPATFFVVGRVAAQNPEVLRFLSQAGHEVANHTWNHFNPRHLSIRSLRRELDRTRLLIHQMTGRDTFLFRTPGGTEKYLRHKFQVPMGYQLVLWDVHSLDQEGLSAEEITTRVLANAKNGDVVLMHNGLDSTTLALETIIPALHARGFTFVTVSDLLENRPSSQLFVRRPVSYKGGIWTR